MTVFSSIGTAAVVPASPSHSDLPFPNRSIRLGCCVLPPCKRKRKQRCRTVQVDDLQILGLFRTMIVSTYTNTMTDLMDAFHITTLTIHQTAHWKWSHHSRYDAALQMQIQSAYWWIWWDVELLCLYWCVLPSNGMLQTCNLLGRALALDAWNLTHKAIKKQQQQQ